MAYDSGATIGQNLQALVNGGCITGERAVGLSNEQKTAIENLTQGQIDTLIAVQLAVGAVPNGSMI